MKDWSWTWSGHYFCTHRQAKDEVNFQLPTNNNKLSHYNSTTALHIGYRLQCITCVEQSMTITIYQVWSKVTRIFFYLQRNFNWVSVQVTLLGANILLLPLWYILEALLKLYFMYVDQMIQQFCHKVLQERSPSRVFFFGKNSQDFKSRTCF